MSNNNSIIQSSDSNNNQNKKIACWRRYCCFCSYDHQTSSGTCGALQRWISTVRQRCCCCIDTKRTVVGINTCNLVGTPIVTGGEEWSVAFRSDNSSANKNAILMEYIITTIQNMGSIIGIYGAYKENIWYIGCCCFIYTIMAVYCGLVLLDMPAALYYAGIVYPNWLYIQELRDARCSSVLNENDNTIDVNYQCYDETKDTEHDLPPATGIEDGQGRSTQPLSCSTESKNVSNSHTTTTARLSPMETTSVNKKASGNDTGIRDGLMKVNNNNNDDNMKSNNSNNKKRWTRLFRK